MNKKNGLIALAMIVVLSLFFVGGEDSSSIKVDPTRVLFADVNGAEIAKIVAEDKQRNLELVVKDNTWLLPSSHNYPVDVGKVRSLLLKLLDITVSQKITNNESRYPYIGVSDECLENCLGLLKLYNNEGDLLAGLVLGKHRQVEGENYSSGQFIRRIGEKDAYLIGETLSFDTDQSNWLNTSVVNILKDNIALVERFALTDGNEDLFASFAADAETGELSLSSGLKGKNLNDEAIKRLHTSLENITFISVSPLPTAEDASDEVEPLVFNDKSSYLLRSNIRYNIWGAVDGDQYFIKLFLTYESPEPIADPSVDKDAEEKGEDEPEDVSQVSSKLASAEDVKLLNDRMKDWIFEISEVDYVGIFLSQEEFIATVSSE